MIDHRDAIELAATSLDFALDDADQQRLDEHLQGCESCRLETAGLHRDAAALASLPDLAPPTWVRTVIGRPRGPRRAVLLVAAALVLSLTVGVALAVGAVLRDRLEPAPQPSAPPTVPSVAPSRGPSIDISPSASPQVGLLPVAKPTSFPVAAGSARIGAGPDGGVWVLVDHPGVGDSDVSTSTVALLGRDGTPLSGWPIRYDGWSCGDDAPPHGLPVAADGSLRLVCAEDMTSEGPQRHVALALGVDGRQLPGWPVDLSTVGLDLPPVMVGDELRILASEVGSADGGGPQTAAWWLMSVSPAGALQVGRRFEIADAVGNFDVRLGADGVAYRVAIADQPAPAPPVVSEITAIDLGGERAGWPVTVEGFASHPVVGPDGLLYIVRRVGSGAGARAQTMTIEPGGGAATATTDGLEIDPLDDRTGAGARVMGPIVAFDGAAAVIGSDATGQMLYIVDGPQAARGFTPTRLEKPLQPIGVCDPQDTGCGVWRAVPAVGRDGTLYVPESAVGEGGGLASSSGGALVAIGTEGGAKGWRIFLPDSMAGFWSVVPRPDGTILALAAIPQDAGPNFDLMILGEDGTALSTTHLVGG
jgi:hypothetical protein